MGPCKDLFQGVYGNIDVFYGMANCLGLGRSSNATGTGGYGNGTLGGGSKKPQSQFTGAAPANGVQRGLWAAMMVFMAAVGWVGVNM